MFSSYLTIGIYENHYFNIRLNEEHSARLKAQRDAEQLGNQRALADTRICELQACLAEAERNCKELQAAVNAGLGAQENLEMVRQQLDAAQQQLSLASEREQQQLMLCSQLEQRVSATEEHLIAQKSANEAEKARKKLYKARLLALESKREEETEVQRVRAENAERAAQQATATLEQVNVKCAAGLQQAATRGRHVPNSLLIELSPSRLTKLNTDLLRMYAMQAAALTSQVVSSTAQREELRRRLAHAEEELNVMKDQLLYQQVLCVCVCVSRRVHAHTERE